MFTNIVLVILCLYAVLTPFLFVYFLKMGVRISENPHKEAEKPTIPKKKRKKVEQSEEERKLMADLEAINSFDGF